MLSAALLLFANTLLFSLRLSGGGSFPKPLSAAEERMWLERYAQGDPEARNVLIERNLRLVAHIIKKGYSGRRNRSSQTQKVARRDREAPVVSQLTARLRDVHRRSSSPGARDTGKSSGAPPRHTPAPPPWSRSHPISDQGRGYAPAGRGPVLAVRSPSCITSVHGYVRNREKCRYLASRSDL